MGLSQEVKAVILGDLQKKENNMKIILTGGHFSPAYSIIQKLTDSEIVVIGRKYAFEGDRNTTFEYSLCQSRGIKFIELSTGRLQRKLTSSTIPSILKFPKGVYSAINILRTERPDVVVTFGGYVALPVAMAAKVLGIPVVLHEQTQQAGLSAKIIAKFAEVTCISFESSKKYFKNQNVVLTGNPIREEFFKNMENATFSAHVPFIYVTGGSTGSHAINEAVGKILPTLLEKYTVIHQTGNSVEFNDYETLTKLKNSLPQELSKKYLLSQFFSVEEVSYLMQNAELVISRSGINTVLELMAVRAVGLLIPLPIGQKNEQLTNAHYYKDEGFGEVLLQKDITPERLKDLIHAIIENRQKYAQKGGVHHKAVIENAAQNIIEQIYHYGRGKEGTKPKTHG